ncbi:hypothetical protein [Klebsiella aerogenes]|uniref:Uncharacterized protein n=1 Tax=Klebsiella aerogenes TaxID=548 RepID=A0AAP9R1T8_KLEAE|nr:hypothetical protein [Klebsiella aerogenes]QMR42788.1 hypothetical protein HV331_24890 [Klebsiella aerogenes]
MTKGTQQSSLDNVSKNTVVNGEHGPQVYFHPGSATLLCVDAKDNRLLIQEQLKMTALLENQKKAQIALDELNFEMLTQAGKQPQRAYDSKLQSTYQQLNDANEKLKAELKSLTAKVPEGELLDENSKGSAIGLMELIPLQKTAGFKSTYVRSDKIRSHWRKYKLSEVDKESGEASFIKYKDKEVTGVDSNGTETKRTVRSGKIDTEELKKQLKEASVSLKFEDELIEDSNVVLTDWAKKMNKGLTWPKENDKPDDESTYHQYVDISAQAQLMRYSQGAGLSAEFNPLEKKASAKMEGHSSFALGEAKASAELFIPDRLGTALLFPAKASAGVAGGVCNMGAIRYTINAVLSGNAGASLGIELGVEADFSGEMAKGYGIKGSPAKLIPPPPPGQRKINLTIPMPDVQAGGEIGAFAGVQAGGNVSGAIEWFDPHPEEDKNIAHDSNKQIVNKEAKFTAIATLSLGVTAQAGGGGSAVFYVTYVNSRFRIYCKAALCWGVGAKGSLGFEVDGNSFAAFMKGFMYMLRNVDYQKLEDMMPRDSFRALCAIPIILAARGLQAGIDTVSTMGDRAADVLISLKDALNDEDKRVRLMENIISNPDQLKYTPPETKGSIIAQLMDVNVLDVIDPKNQKRDTKKWGAMQLRKEAIMRCFTWVQSKADYNNVMQHMTINPAEGKGSAEANEKTLLEFLGMTEFGIMGSYSTQYERHLHTLYERLPDTVDPDEPFKPIPKDEMAEYIAFINEAHNSNSQMA